MHVCAHKTHARASTHTHTYIHTHTHTQSHKQVLLRTQALIKPYAE